MFTDRAPFEYRYMSRRLLGDLFRQDEIFGSRWRAKADIGLSVANLSIEQLERNDKNTQSLAWRSTDLVSDHTADLDTVFSGQYLRMQADLRFGIFEALLGWRVDK